MYPIFLSCAILVFFSSPERADRAMGSEYLIYSDFSKSQYQQKKE
jgi:hypothetical protein